MDKVLLIKDSDFPEAKMPVMADQGCSGYDLYSAEQTVVNPGQVVMVRTGLKLGYLHPDYEIQIRPRSGNAAKKGLTVTNAPGTVDSSYRGAICVLLHVVKQEPVTINVGDRIAQMVVCPVVRPELAWTDKPVESDRGEKGFGSSGVVGDLSKLDIPMKGGIAGTKDWSS